MKGHWADRARAGDKAGPPRDFLLTPPRERDAAEAFGRKALPTQERPEKSTSDQSGTTPAAIQRSPRLHQTGRALRQCNDLTPLVEQEPRAGKRKVRPRLGCPAFWAARGRRAGREGRHAMRKGQRGTRGTGSQTPAAQFSALATEVTKNDNLARPHLQFTTEPLILFVWWITVFPQDAANHHAELCADGFFH